MIAFSTLAEPQTGQVTSAALRLLVVGGRVLEPALEGVAVLAIERVTDHSGASHRVQVRRLGHRLDQLEAPAVMQRGNARARRRDLRRIDRRRGSTPGSVPPSARILAPRIDHERMAESLAAVLVPAALGGGEHEAAVLDRACAHQNVPMRLAGLLGEGRGDREERSAGLGQRAIERREAQIVADGQAEPAPRQVGDDRELARPIAVRLRDSSRRRRDRRRTCGSCRSARRCRRLRSIRNERFAALSGDALTASEPIWI